MRAIGASANNANVKAGNDNLRRLRLEDLQDRR